MIERFRRWFAADDSGVDFAGLSEWSRQFGGHFKRAREGDGFVLDASWSGRPWRLGWGPSQRAYIPGRELDLRMELGLPTDLQMLVMNRPLAESLENLAFEQCTQSMQTVIDCAAPEEMRWLSMFPKVNLSAQNALRARYGAWSSAPSLALWWLEGPLSQALEELARHWLPEDIPFVLMTLRGRLYLRCQIPVPTLDLLDQMQWVFILAAEQALRIANQEPMDNSSPVALDCPSTLSGAWPGMTAGAIGGSLSSAPQGRHAPIKLPNVAQA
jgi:hypothetical protein